MKLGPYDLDEQVLVVAEIGNNHEGRFEIAQRLVREAAAAGAHAVKFQTYRTELFVRRSDEARWQRMKQFELSFREFAELQRLAHSLGLLFISTPLDLDSAQFLSDYVDAYKIASGDNNFFPLLRFVAGTGKPLIVSTGLSDLTQVIQVQEFLKSCSSSQSPPKLIWLHCVSCYPVPEDQLNLAAIPLLMDRLGCRVGYSDHTVGLDACLAAVALGACLIEKHFTLDKNFSSFRDHQLSATPAEMRQLVERVRRIRAMRGQPIKLLQPCERDLAITARRSIVAARDLPAGHVICDSDLLWLRPADGLAPGNESQLRGRRLREPRAQGQIILPQHVE